MLWTITSRFAMLIVVQSPPGNILTIRGSFSNTWGSISSNPRGCRLLTFPTEASQYHCGSRYHDRMGFRLFEIDLAIIPVMLAIPAGLGLEQGWQEEHLMGRAGILNDESWPSLIPVGERPLRLCSLWKSDIPLPKMVRLCVPRLECAEAWRQSESCAVSDGLAVTREIPRGAVRVCRCYAHNSSDNEPLSAHVSSFFGRPFL